MEVAPFFVDFHHFLSIFTIFIDFHDLRTFVVIYILSRFTQIFFGQNSLLRNITRFLHVCSHQDGLNQDGSCNSLTREHSVCDSQECFRKRFLLLHFLFLLQRDLAKVIFSQNRVDVHLIQVSLHPITPYGANDVDITAYVVQNSTRQSLSK